MRDGYNLITDDDIIDYGEYVAWMKVNYPGKGIHGILRYLCILR